MTTAIDFKDVIDSTLTKMLAERSLESMVQGHIEKMLTRTVEELFRSYGPVTKQIEQQLAESINLNGLIDVQGYNARLASLVQSKMDSILDDMASGQISKVINAALEPAPKTIKLSKLVEQYVSDLRESNDSSCSCDDEHTAYFALEERDNDGYTKGYYDFVLNDGPVEKYSQPDVQAMVSSDGTIYHLRFGGQKANWMMAGTLGDFEKSLWRMLACGTKIERDCEPDDCDLDYGRSHD